MHRRESVPLLLTLLLLGSGCVAETPAEGSEGVPGALRLPRPLLPYEAFAGALPEKPNERTTIEAAWADLTEASHGSIPGDRAVRLATDGHAFWVQLVPLAGPGNSTGMVALDLFTRVVNDATAETVAAGRLQNANGTSEPVLLPMDAPYGLRDPLRWEVLAYPLPEGATGLAPNAANRRPLDPSALPQVAANATGCADCPAAPPDVSAGGALLQYWSSAAPLVQLSRPIDRAPGGGVIVEGPTEGRDTFDELEQEPLGPWSTGNYTVTVEARNFFVGILFIDLSPSVIVGASPNTTRYEGSAATLLLDGMLPLDELANRPPGVPRIDAGAMRFTFEVDHEVRSEPATVETFEVFASLELGYKWRGQVHSRFQAFGTLPVSVTFEPAL